MKGGDRIGIKGGRRGRESKGKKEEMGMHYVQYLYQ
jgi:hypothetical protein